MDTAQFVTGISAITALLALLGAFYTTRKQITASIVSANRQKWIDTLRDCISELLASSGIHLLNAHRKDTNNSDRLFERLAFLKAKIELLLNPNEKDHVELKSEIDLLIVFSDGDASKQASQFSECRTKVILLSQSILKREWERVKKGD